MLARAAPHRNGHRPNVGEAASAAILAWPKTSVSSAEAGSLIALYDTLNVYAPQTREPVQHDLVCYMRSIVDDEWPSMARGRDLEATRTLRFGDRLRAQLRALPTDGSGQASADGRSGSLVTD